jgi:hypothetical protein
VELGRVLQKFTGVQEGAAHLPSFFESTSISLGRRQHWAAILHSPLSGFKQAGTMIDGTR